MKNKFGKLVKELTIMDDLKIKPNYAALSRIYKCDWRTVKKYYNDYKGKINKFISGAGVEFFT